MKVKTDVKAGQITITVNVNNTVNVTVGSSVTVTVEGVDL